MDDRRNTLLPAVAPTLVFLGLIVFQPDLGTAIACAGITACVLFVAGIRLRYFGYALAASIAAALFPDLPRLLSPRSHLSLFSIPMPIRRAAAST